MLTFDPLRCVVALGCSVSIETVVEAGEVCGRCEVVCGEDIEGDKDDWFLRSPDRFLFFEVLKTPCLPGSDNGIHGLSV